MTKTKKTRNTTNAFVDKSPDWLRSEPVGEAPAPPVGGVRKHGLPFLELEWANFERLCHRLAEQDARVEDAWAYGKSGHAQHGIDILVRLNDGAYEVWQTKRHKTFSPSKLAGAVDFFLAHQWAARAKRFVLAVACDFSSPDTLKAVEDARDKLKAKEVEFEPLDASKLSKRLYNEPELVDLFFDRPWVKRFCSDESQRKVANTLSRFELASTRQRLLDWYRSWALTVDGGLPIAGPDHLGRARPPVPLVKRFIEPDVLVGFVSHDDSLPSSSQETQEGRTSDETTGNIDTEIRVARKSAPIHTLDKRLPVSRLLSTERKVVVAGAAGAGKSTLLRVLAIDLLEESTTLGLSGFADHLPIWIPFAYWANLSKGSTPVGLQAVVRAFFEAHSDIVLADALTRALNSVKVILLVDGLDEASDPVVAKTLAGLLVTFAEHNDLPVIATTRPQGLPFISGQATGWSQSHLAPLSDSQRRSLAHLWFAVLERIGDATLSAASVEQRAAQNAKALISALKRSPGTARLSQTPLFLLALLTLHRDGHVLPRSRFAAAKVMVEQLIEHQPSKRASAALETIAKPVDRLRDRLLDDFAFALHSDHFKGDVPNAASEHDAIDRATVIALERLGGHDREKAEERARSIFHFGEERAGLLVKPIGGNIGFLHLTFQEYLAAKHVFGLPPSHRRRFVCEHAHLQKWREPILYLLFLLNNEHDVSDIVSAIEDVEAKNSQTHAWALLVQAVFSDFAHHPANVRRLAKRFFSEVEMAAWGYRLRHLLSCITDGLLSEAVSDLCHAKIAEWMPDRHGYARAPIVRAVQHWDKAVQPAILDFLKRNLSADRYISRPSSEILVHVTKADPSTKSFFQDLIRTGPSVEAVTAGLYGLACGWPTDADVLETADIARKSIDRRVSIEGIRIRARAMRTTTEDLDTFIKAARFGDHFAGEGLLAPDLLEHFGAVHRGDFIARLEKKYQATRHSRPHELIAIIGALIYCDPSHRYVAEGLKLILEDTWTWDYIFSRGGFPASRVPWQGELLAVVESYVTQKEKHREYELYWIAKVCPTPALKQKILEALRTKQHLSFWSARALVEVWGPTHPETVSAFEELIEARYRFIIGQLMAFTNAHGLTVTSLLEAARLFGQLEIDEGVKLHRSALANSLASAALALDGKLGEARTLHSQHPLHSLRDEIFSRSEFQTSTEFYFGVSDVFLAALVAKEHPDRRWLHLFEREPDWKLSDLERMNFNSYRSFALGLIRMAEGHREIARDMLLAAATQRLSIFSQFQRTSAENFHLPSLVDKIVIAVGLASAVEKGGNDSIEIILRGSELLSRNLRHHLVDAAALLASQPNPGARRRAHAFIHLLGKKREWELDKIRKLVSNDGIEQLRGVVLEHYTKAVGKIAELKQKIRFNSAPENSSGLQQLQRSLQPRQAYVGYFPFLGGVGKLCVTAENWKIATAPYDLSIIDDVKTLASAVMQFPRNAKEAAQYPTAAAVRINQFLFGGLESCLTPGTHVTVALPPEFTSVPLGALLRDERGLRDGKLDLRNAHWLINDLSFSIVLSAQHHLATSSDQSRDAGQRAYLGIGDPHLDGDHRTALASTKLFRGSLKTPHGVLDFSPLPETSDELEAVGKLFGANSQDILVGKRGTEEAFRARPLGEYDVIHFATHGLVSTDLAGLADSALILTPTSSLDTYDDGLLSATEISRLSLNARMVVLSACNTAKYDVAQATRGVQDLQAAFTVAGAPTLIASLWPVDSLATKDLITNFLRQWRSANSRGAAEALAKTIRAHIVDADNLHRHPSYWAPFVVVGNGGVVGARSTQMSQRAPAFEFLNGFSDGGEIYHVAQVGSDALVSLIGEWDGSKMNGITSRRSLGGAEKWRVGSREIGSGRVSVFADYIYAAGYTTTKNPVPVVRAFTLDGRLRWKTEYPDLTGYLFSDIISNSSGALIVAYPHLVPTTEPKDVLVLSIKKDGTLRRKTNIGPRLSNINLGSPALITHWNNRVVVVINSGQTSKLKFDKKTIAGLPTICWDRGGKHNL